MNYNKPIILTFVNEDLTELIEVFASSCPKCLCYNKCWFSCPQYTP